MRILYIDIDSLRPDHLGCHGYERSTSPNIDAFAEEAVRFERAYVANSPCMPSRAAFVSGRYGIHNGVDAQGPAAQELRSLYTNADHGGDWQDWWNLPELFFMEGYATCAVSTFPRHPSPWFHRHWDEFHQPRGPRDREQWGFQHVPGENVADRAIDVLDRHEDEAFFLYAQFWDPHTPYHRRDEEVERFEGDDAPHPYPTDEQIKSESHQRDRSRSASDWGIENRDDLAEDIAQYDAEIRHTDRHVGRLLDELRDRGLYDETLIVVTADHGDEFGEHGTYRMHGSTHDGTQRVPLLLKPPADRSVERGHRDQLITNVDVAPTLADYADLEAPEEWQGRSLRPIVENPEAGWRDYIVVDHAQRTVQRAVRTDRWKLVRTYHPGEFPDLQPELQLFDMRADPWEQENLADEYPDVVETLRGKMAIWAEEHVGIEGDPLRQTARRWSSS